MQSSQKAHSRKPSHKAVKSGKNWRQFFRYLVVGGSSFAIEYSAFFVLLQLYHVHYLLANSLVYGVVSAVNFAINRLWTFKSQTRVGRQVALYLTLLAFNFLASNLMLYILSGKLLVPPLLAKVAVMVMVVLWNFVLYKKVIYR